MKWRKWNNILHRDIGYLTVGMTIIFAISGIAVNHIHHWNPNFKIVQQPVRIAPVYAQDTEGMVKEVLAELEVADAVESYFRPDPESLRIFFENQTIEINILTGEGYHERVSERFLLTDFNFLHLNHAKKVWTYVSDIYAIALIFLAISGMFVLKGRKGITGRGAWLTATGVILPVLFLLYYKYF